MPLKLLPGIINPKISEKSCSNFKVILQTNMLTKQKLQSYSLNVKPLALNTSKFGDKSSIKGLVQAVSSTNVLLNWHLKDSVIGRS